MSRTTYLQPWALGHDGRSFFATVRSPRFSGVAKVNARTSAVTEIQGFDDPADEQALGAFDGRWLVWNEYRGFANNDDFTTWAWNSYTGKLRQIGAAVRAQNGQFWPSPLGQPSALDGVATWTQGIGPGGLTAVHVYDLRTGLDSIVRRGHAQESFLLRGGLVAWPESPAPGAWTRIYVASTRTGKRVKTPAALRTLRGVSGLHTDGHRIAYPSGRYRSLWWSASLQRAPRKILLSRAGWPVDDSVQVAGRYIGFGIYPGVFVADTRKHSYVQVGNRGGLTLVDSSALLGSFPTSATKGPQSLNRIVVVPLRDLPRMPPCAHGDARR